jgi:hypothetical protein
MTGDPSSILLIADPGVPAVIAERLSESLPSALTDRADGAAADGEWDVSVRRDSYAVDEHTEVVEVIRTVDPAGETEDIVIYLTDLPRRIGTTPVIVDISHTVGLSTLLMMAWLAAAVATLGGALGSGLEDDEAVKAAAYGVRQRQRFVQGELTHRVIRRERLSPALQFGRLQCPRPETMSAIVAIGEVLRRPRDSARSAA